MRIAHFFATAFLACVLSLVMDAVYRGEDLRVHPSVMAMHRVVAYVSSRAQHTVWDWSTRIGLATTTAVTTASATSATLNAGKVSGASTVSSATIATSASAREVKIEPAVASSPLKAALSRAVPEGTQSLPQRHVITVIKNREQPEGMNARVRRSIGTGKLQNFDPILLLDHFTVKPPAGFPDHFHRGFETVTFILPESQNTVNHEDFAGHAGEIGPGDVQWMTAGRGIVHAEMPGRKTDAPAVGIQLWVNLSKKNKMVEPRYQELLAKDIPTVYDSEGGVSAYIIAGTALGVSCPIQTLTPTHYIYYTLQPGAELKHVIPKHWNAFLYTLSGAISVSGESGSNGASGAGADSGASDCPDLVTPIEVEPFHTVVYDRQVTKPAGTSPIDAGQECTGDAECDVISVTAHANADGKPSKFVLIAAEPLHEPIVQYGPVVMTTRDEIRQAFQDYSNGVNGFERAKDFKSKIAGQ